MAPTLETEGKANQKLNRICVYCGSSPGNSSSYAMAAEELGNELIKRNLSLVYGGGNNGLMGAIAQAVDNGGGTVIGIIPKALMPREISGKMIGEIHVVDDMHQRKSKMAQFSDAFIAMPGGFGTLEELMEMITWHQLGIHSKPIGLLNVDDYYSNLLSFFDDMVEKGFVTKEHKNTIISSSSPSVLIDKLMEYTSTHNPITSPESWKLGYDTDPN